MRKTILLQTVIALFLAYQASVCLAAETWYTSSRTTTITTKTSTTTSVRKVRPSCKIRKTAAASQDKSLASPAHQVIKKVGNGRNDANCVLYLRQQRGIKLPAKNLTTYASKVAIINSSVPQEKSVAIIRTPGKNARFGHLAEVTGLEENNGKITMRLAEANNPYRGYFKRTITGESLEDIQKNAYIVGYYVEPY